MSSEQLVVDRVWLYAGDCLDVLPTLAENSIDSCVCDPPYGISFMGRSWDHGVPGVPYWREVYRVMKPGAHLLTFGGTRTYHRMACAIEDAGFEVRDCVQWIYGQGLPKSLDVSKAIDRAAGAHREIIGPGTRHNSSRCSVAHGDTERLAGGVPPLTAPATDAARQWSGWGTAFKPACEMIAVARKPLSEGTITANVLRWETGAINVDGCRIESGDKTPAPVGQYGSSTIGPTGHSGKRNGSADHLGRWPANIIHDGSDEVVAMFPETQSGSLTPNHKHGRAGTSQHEGWDRPSHRDYVIQGEYGNDSGSAARFFYTAKADADDRLGSKHPTVKPVDLMQYLCRLVTPPSGLVLDPFAGTGTTGEATWREGMRAILIEREPEYQEDIRRRMRLVLAGPDERAREAIKAKLKGKPDDAGPLFGGAAS